MLNADTAIIKLLQLGVISKTTKRGHYNMVDRPRESTFTRADIYARFTYEVVPGSFEILYDVVREAQAAARPLRTIFRRSYHGGERNYEQYIQAVPYDEDGVRRTFGLEYEIYRLTPAQESELAYLLDTLPAHVTERDGSLHSTGVEIVFMPMGREDYIKTVKTLKEFIDAHRVQMQEDDETQAGMHTTYGVSNAEATKVDLQIRLNRFAYTVAALGRKDKIVEIFGRYFGHYRELPAYSAQTFHANAFSTNGRPSSCWECRLPSYKADPEKLVEFFKITESAFHRAFRAEDFEAVYNLLGRDTSGC